MNNKLAIGVVTYKPSFNLTQRLKVSIELGYSVYIFDNSPEFELIREFSKQFSMDNVKYFTCGKNVGLGFGISLVCAQAYFDSYSALLFFDQDTVFNKSTLDYVSKFYNYNIEILTYYSAIIFNSKNAANNVFDSVDNRDKFIFKEVKLAINSGSLYLLENSRKINWHNETFFVDGVDYEFCLKSNINNLKIGECSFAPGFDHETEQDDEKYLIFNKIFKMREYSSSRIIDTLSANIRLILFSIRAHNFIYTVEICRLLAGYLFYQILARLFRNSKYSKMVS